MSECPCCGQPLPGIPFKVDLNTNTALRGDDFVRLTRREAEIATILADSYPKIIHHERILARLHGGDWEYGAKNVLDVHVCRLRHKLRKLGVDIPNVWGQGYRIVLHESD